MRSARRYLRQFSQETKKMTPESEEPNEKLVRTEGFEPPAYGSGNHGPTVLPVRNSAFAVGYDTPRLAPSPQFVHQCAPHPVTPDPGFTPIQALLPLLTISKRRLRQVEAIQLVRERRENRRQDIAYNARPFVLCGLPLRQPAKDQLVYTRRNGNFQLEIKRPPSLWFTLRPGPPDTDLARHSRLTSRKAELFTSTAPLNYSTTSVSPRTALDTTESERLFSASSPPRFSSEPTMR